MNFSQEIGQTLAETLTELFALDDIPLNEIRHHNELSRLASQALLANDPQKRQEIQRMLALRKRKWNVSGMREDEAPKVGDKVRSKQHGTVGYFHHVGDRGKAWVSDNQDGSSGQFYHPSDLMKHTD